jgi:secondary thiamine-phosphate synthase enzyme
LGHIRDISQVTAGRLAIMTWTQRQIVLPAASQGFHLITEEVLAALPELLQIRTGLLHVFIQHTSASLTINENADPDVPADLESSFAAIAPEDFPYRHTCEGPDDMPAHVKAALLGSSVSVPIANGKLCLGTWQGIYLCEHRRHGGKRRLVLTVWGEKRNK